MQRIIKHILFSVESSIYLGEYTPSYREHVSGDKRLYVIQCQNFWHKQNVWPEFRSQFKRNDINKGVEVRISIVYSVQVGQGQIVKPSSRAESSSG